MLKLEWDYPCLKDGTKCWFSIDLERISETELAYVGSGLLPLISQRNDNEITEYMLQKLDENIERVNLIEKA